MSETTQAIDYDSMQRELAATGDYVIYADSFTVVVQHASFVIDYRNTKDFEAAKNKAIETAYAHYQKEKRYQAMEALLREFIGETYYAFDCRGNLPEKITEYTQKARKLLGE